MNEETVEKKSNKKIIIIIVLCVVIAIIIGIIVYLLTRPKEVEEDKFKNVVRDTVKIEKLNGFVSTGIFNDYGNEGLAYDFAKGLDKLTNEQKNKFVLQYIVNIAAVTEKVTEETLAEKYKSDPVLGDYSKNMSQVSSRTFEKEYEKFFGNKPEFTEKDLQDAKICPSVYKYDSRVKRIYLSNECEKEGDTILYYKTYNYKNENDHYYVYQYIGLKVNKKEGEAKDTFKTVNSNQVIDVEDFTGNESKFETLVWEFDENYNFIKTYID